MKNTKRIILILSLVVSLVALFAVAASAATKSGTINSAGNLSYTYDEETATLTITGEGASLVSDTWLNWGNLSTDANFMIAAGVQSSVKKIDLSGATKLSTITDMFFVNCTALEEIIIPESLTSYRNSCIHGSASLKYIKVAGVDYSEYGDQGVYDLRNATKVDGWTFNYGAANVKENINILLGKDTEIVFMEFMRTRNNPVTFFLEAGGIAEEKVLAAKETVTENWKASTWTIKYYGDEIGADQGGAGNEEANLPEGIVAQGKYESQYSNIEWSIDENGVLKIMPIDGATDWNEIPYMNKDIVPSTWLNGHQAKIKKVIIGPTLKKIGAEAFKNCVNLEVVEMADVGQITAQVFMGCTSLKTIYIAGNTPVEGEFDLSNVGVLEANSQFTGCAMTSVKLGAGLVTVNAATFENCESLTNVTFGEKIESIGEFVNCPNLKVLFGTKGGVVETFANDNGYTFAEVGSIVDIPDAVITTAPEGDDTTAKEDETTAKQDDTTAKEEESSTAPDEATQTGDVNVVMIVAFAVAALGSAVVISRKRRFN